MDVSPWWLQIIHRNHLSAGWCPGLVFAHFTPWCVHCSSPLFLCGHFKLLLWKHKHQKTNLQSTDNGLVCSAALWRSLQSRHKPSALLSEPSPTFGWQFPNFLHTSKKYFIFSKHKINVLFSPHFLISKWPIYVFKPSSFSDAEKNRQSRKIPACKGCLVLIILPKKLKDLSNGNTKWELWQWDKQSK